jgi:hypothetical protein
MVDYIAVLRIHDIYCHLGAIAATMKWGEAGEDMTRGRPSRAAEGESGGGGGRGGGKGLRCTVLYSIHRTHTKLHVYKQGGGGVGAGQPAYSQLVSEFGGINT